MKDFFDPWTFAKKFEFDGLSLSKAVEATFNRRETPLPVETPMALTSEFVEDSSKQNQWSAFAKKLDLSLSLSDATSLIEKFIMPCVVSIRENNPFNSQWRNEAWKIHEERWTILEVLS